MSRWSARRGQVEPTAALVALFAVCACLSLYAGVLGEAMPEPTGRNLAEPTLDETYDVVAEGGVVDPEALGEGRRAGPSGHRVNVTVAVDGRRWTSGPAPPSSADAAQRPTSVTVGVGRTVPGRLRVEVWP